MIFQVKGLVKSYNSRKVLDIKELDLEKGGIYGLLGPNGSGKTTLLQILAFLESWSRGAVYFQGRQVSGNAMELKRNRRKVVLVDQHPILFTTSVFKNVEFGLKVRKISKSNRKSIAMEALDRVGMADFAPRPACRLSGGETQRVAIARALALNPQVLLCDEPTSSVDAQHQSEVLRILRQINEINGITVIFTTHEQSHAAYLAKKILYLNKGRLASPVSGNLFQGWPVFKSNRAAVFRINDDFHLRLPIENSMAIRGKTRIFIDPKKIRLLTTNSVTLPDNSYMAKVVQLSGENGFIRLKVDAGVELILFLSVSVYRKANPRIGDTLSIQIPPEAARLLDEGE